MVEPVDTVDLKSTARKGMGVRVSPWAPDMRKIIGLLDKDGNIVESLDKGVEGYVIFDTTPFMPRCGGQSSDTGHLISNNEVVAEVIDVFTLKKGY